MRTLRRLLVCLALMLCAGENGFTQSISEDPRDAHYDEALFEINADHRRTLDGDYKSLTQGNMSLFMSMDKNDYLGLQLGFGAFQLKPGSFADAIARQPFYFDPQIVFRHYFTPPHVFVRPYVTMSAGCIWAIWDYREPMVVGDQKVRTDSLKATDASAGLGLLFQFNENFHVFGEVDAGGIMMVSDETDSGVQNTFFDNTAYVGVKAGLGLSF